MKILKPLIFKIILTYTALACQATLAEELIPQSAIKPLLSGYSPQEQVRIQDDLVNIRKLVFRDKKPAVAGQKPVYVASAGAPGARKSTILETYLQKKDYFSAVYIDPDQRALKYMHTYQDSLSNHHIMNANTRSLSKVREEAYNHWRNASNYIANTLLNEAFTNRYSIAHGTTLTGEHSASLLQKLRAAGYEIQLILCFASENFRKEAVEYRNEVQGFYQSTPGDFADKSILFYKRMPVYLNNADLLFMHWSESLEQSIRLAAQMKPNPKGLVVSQDDDFKKIGQTYDAAIQKDKTLAPWNELLKSYK